MLRRSIVLASVSMGAAQAGGLPDPLTSHGQNPEERTDIGVGAPAPAHAVTLVGSNGTTWMRFEGGVWPRPARTSDDLAAGPQHVEVGGGSGDLITTTSFGDCRLHVEWFCPAGGDGQDAGNSGVYLQNRYEIQVLGTPAGSDPLAPNEAGAIYRVKAADRNASTGTGTWQAYDIWFRAPRFEGERKTADARVAVVWNGTLVHDDVPISHPTGSRQAGGESSVSPVQLGPLHLQDHTSAAEGPVRYRNVWIAPLDEISYEEGSWIDLFDDQDEDAWIVRGGKAVYRFDDGVLIGETRPSTPNTFYTSRETYRDFELVYDVKVDARLNSGVQVRSHVLGGLSNRDGGLQGYQIEIDPSERRAFSAGVYDERRRGWLHPLHDAPEARGVFRAEAWNSFRVVAQGPVIRTWINGVPAAAIFDAVTPEGHLGFQVHGVGDRVEPMQVRFRNARLRPLTPR